MFSRLFTLIVMFLFSVAPVFATMLLLGVGGATDGSSYNPLGAVFMSDVMAGVNGSALGVTNTPQHTLSFWQNGSQTALTGFETTLMNGAVIWSAPGNKCEVTAGTAPGLCLSFDSSTSGVQFNFNNSAGSTPASDAVKFNGPGSTSSALPTYGDWHHYLVSFDTAAGVWAVYVDGAPASYTATVFPANMQPDFNNYGGWWLGNSALSVSVAYSWLAEVYESNRSIVCTGLNTPYTGCLTTGTISSGMLAKFYSGGKPVPLGTNCTGPDGAQPQICLTGSGAAMGTNQGSVAAVTTNSLAQKTTGAVFAQFATTITMSAGPAGTGVAAGWKVWDQTTKLPVGTVQSWSGTTLSLQSPYAANAGGSGDILLFTGSPVLPVAAAPYGPAGIPAHQPTLRWVAEGNQTLSTTITLNSGGNTIAVGDLLIAVMTNSNSSGTAPTAPCPTQGTWTPIASPQDTVGDITTTLCYQIQGSAVIGKTNLALTSTPMTQPGRSQDWMLLDFANASGVNVSGCYVTPSASASWNTATLTTTVPNTTLVSMVMNWSRGQGFILTPPATGITPYRSYNSGSWPYFALNVQAGLPNSSPTLRTWSISGGTDTAIGCSIALAPN